jgi:hypothetical protein
MSFNPFACGIPRKAIKRRIARKQRPISDATRRIAAPQSDFFIKETVSLLAIENIANHPAAAFS